MSLAEFLNFMDLDFCITSGARIKLIDPQGDGFMESNDVEYDSIEEVVADVYDEYKNHIENTILNTYNGDWFSAIMENEYILETIYYMANPDKIKLFNNPLLF